jgi:hypothetical protein
MPRENNDGNVTAVAPDRRTSRRFPLHLAVRYRSVGPSVPSDWTVAESVNISSAGLLFKTAEAVIPGQAVEAFIAWPVFLDKHIPLKLAIKGRVVRNTGDHTAMCVETYEFRTCHTSDSSLKTGE